MKLLHYSNRPLKGFLFRNLVERQIFNQRGQARLPFIIHSLLPH